MKITKQKLVEIIKEELEAALNEEEADCRHLFGQERADCIEQAKNREINRGQAAEDLATVVGREMSGSLKSVKRKLDILDRIHSGEIKTVNAFRTALEAAKNAESLEAALDESKSPMPLEDLTDAEWEFWKSAFKEAEAAGADVDEASAHANAEVDALRNAETSEALPANDDGIDF